MVISIPVLAQISVNTTDTDGNRILTEAGGIVKGSLTVSNGLYVVGPVNLGTNTSFQGAIIVSSNQTTAATGMIRWNPVSSNFEGYTGTEWITLGNVYAD
jgi:hypothetical protein